MAHYLLVIGDRVALGWLLRVQRMAFPATSRREVAALAPGDGLFIYTTRGCFKNPTRDRGRVIGRARAATAVLPLDTPVSFGGRDFARGCGLTVEGLVPLGTGPELRSLGDVLGAFRALGAAWPVLLRRPLLALDDADAAALDGALGRVHPPEESLVAPYARWFDQAR